MSKSIKEIFPIFKCHCCGKKFCLVYNRDYKYKIRKQNETRYYCSYTCYRKEGGDGGGSVVYYRKKDKPL